MFSRFVDWFNSIDDTTATCCTALAVGLSIMLGCFGGWVVAVVL